MKPTKKKGLYKGRRPVMIWFSDLEKLGLIKAAHRTEITNHHFALNAILEKICEMVPEMEQSIRKQYVKFNSKSPTHETALPLSVMIDADPDVNIELTSKLNIGKVEE